MQLSLSGTVYVIFKERYRGLTDKKTLAEAKPRSKSKAIYLNLSAFHAMAQKLKSDVKQMSGELKVACFIYPLFQLTVFTMVILLCY